MLLARALPLRLRLRAAAAGRGGGPRLARRAVAGPVRRGSRLGGSGSGPFGRRGGRRSRSRAPVGAAGAGGAAGVGWRGGRRLRSGSALRRRPGAAGGGGRRCRPRRRGRRSGRRARHGPLPGSSGAGRAPGAARPRGRPGARGTGRGRGRLGGERPGRERRHQPAVLLHDDPPAAHVDLLALLPLHQHRRGDEDRRVGAGGHADQQREREVPAASRRRTASARPPASAP